MLWLQFIAVVVVLVVFNLVVVVLLIWLLPLCVGMVACIYFVGSCCASGCC